MWNIYIILFFYQKSKKIENRKLKQKKKEMFFLILVLFEIRGKLWLVESKLVVESFENQYWRWGFFANNQSCGGINLKIQIFENKWMEQYIKMRKQSMASELIWEWDWMKNLEEGMEEIVRRSKDEIGQLLKLDFNEELVEMRLREEKHENGTWCIDGVCLHPAAEAAASFPTHLHNLQHFLNLEAIPNDFHHLCWILKFHRH